MRVVGLIVFLILFENCSFAQSDDKVLFQLYSKLGIQAGGPLYQSETIVAKEGSPGFNPLAGLGVSYHLNKKFALVFECFYSRRKINYSSEVRNQFYADKQTIYINNEPFIYDIKTFFTGTTKGSFDMHYLELPLIVQYKLTKKLLLQAGPYYAWAFSRENTGKASGIVGRTDISNPNTIDNKDYDNSSHLNIRYWGLLSGVQYQISPRVVADFRMTYSFVSLYNKNWEGVDYTLKDLYGQLSFNYVFLKK